MALLSNQSLTFKVVEALGMAIVSGVYGAQNPLPVEGDLHKQYGTSRGTLREAVKMLAAKGLLGARPRHGTWVEPETNWNWLDPDVLRWSHYREISSAALRELAEFRLLVEPPAAALAARTTGRRSVEAIKSALDRLAAAQIGEDDALEAELSFHAAVMRAAGNRFVTQFLGATELAIRLSSRLAHRLKAEHPLRVADYARVFHAIVARDAQTAEAALRAIVRESLDLIDQAETEAQEDDRLLSVVASRLAS